MKRKNEELEFNQSQIPFDVFLVDYNQHIPKDFPKASAESLKKFREAHPSLFRQKDLWSVAKHRKRVMDWLSSNPELV
ncbi:MAG: hypothetical protein WD898_02655 [Candidatus Paceibacterota bacterium]